MWTFMKENKSEWAGRGPDPLPASQSSAGPRAPVAPPFVARTLLWAPQAPPSLVFCGRPGGPAAAGPGMPPAPQSGRGYGAEWMEHPLTSHFVPDFLPVLDMQQTYDMWLKKHNPGKPGEGTPISSREGEKQIQMPTDYADIMVMTPRACWRRGLGRSGDRQRGGAQPPRGGVRSGHPWWLCPQMGYHCWLCGKNSNSKKQWQQHIQSEKHKEKVFTSDSDASGWAYRFPMGEFRLCDRCTGGPARVDGQWAWGEAVARSGSSWPGGGSQGVVCETAAPGRDELGTGWHLARPIPCSSGSGAREGGTCPLSAGLKLPGEACGGRLSG